MLGHCSTRTRHTTFAGIAILLAVTGCSAGSHQDSAAKHSGTHKISTASKSHRAARTTAAAAKGRWRDIVVGDVQTLRGDPKSLTSDVAAVKADLTIVSKHLNIVRRVVALGPDAECDHAQAASDDATQVSNDGTQVYNDSDLVEQDAFGAGSDSDQLSEDLQTMREHHDGQPPSDMRSVRAAALKAMKDAVRETNKLIDSANRDASTAVHLANGLAAQGCPYDHIFVAPPNPHISAE